MSGICGWVGEADPAVLDAMLDAIDYRGDRTDKAFAPGVALGYRWWGGRPGKPPDLHALPPGLGAESAGDTLEQYTAVIDREITRWAKSIKAVRIKGG